MPASCSPYRCLFLLLLSLPLFSLAQRTDWSIYTPNFSFEHFQYLYEAQLPSAEVSGVAHNRNGDLYVAVKDSGIFYLPQNGHQFVHFRLPLDLAVYDTTITALVIDQQDQFWIGTSKGLLRYDGWDWTQYSKEITPGFPFVSIADLFLAPDGKLYVTGFDDNIQLEPNTTMGAGLVVFQGEGWTAFHALNSEMPFDFVTDLCLDPQGSLWMTAGWENKGVLQFDGQNFTWLRQLNGDLPTDSVRGLSIGPDGTVYLGTAEGVFLGNGNRWEALTVSEKNDQDSLVQSRYQADVRCLAADSTGTLWIGTAEAGLHRIRQGRLKRLTFDRSPITSNYIRKIRLDRKGRTWFFTGRQAERLADLALPGTAANGFRGVFSCQTLYPRQDEGWTLFHAENTLLENEKYHELAVAPDGHLWLTNGSKGLYQLDGHILRYHPIAGLGDLGRLFALTLGPDGTVYAGSQTHGLAIYREGKVEILNKKNSAVGNVVLQLAVGPENEVWFASFRGAGRITNFSVENHNKKSADLPSNAVKAIAVAKDGTTWLALQKGVGRYQNGRWTFWEKKNSPLPANIINDIVVDSEGQAWAVSHEGVSYFDGDRWHTFDKINNIDWGFTVAAAGPNGKVYVGTNEEGLLVYENAQWSHYHADNSPLYLPRIQGLAVASDGTVWIHNTLHETLPGEKSFVESEVNVPYDSEAAVLKQILTFDPLAQIVRWRP
jgi:ligand-binding sensor domain-containing protein